MGGRAKVRTTAPLCWNCCLCGRGSGTQDLAFLCPITAELNSLCFLLSAERSASADSCLIAWSTNSENRAGLDKVSAYLISVARPPRNLAMRLASVETSSVAYLASLMKARLYSCTVLSPCLRAKNSSASSRSVHWEYEQP